MGLPIMWYTFSHIPYKHPEFTATATYCFDTQEEANAFLDWQSQNKERTEAFYMAMPVFSEPCAYCGGELTGAEEMLDVRHLFPAGQDETVCEHCLMRLLTEGTETEARRQWAEDERELRVR